MNKLHLLWIIPVFLIILALLINIFDFVGATKIKVVDGLTDEPLQNMNVVQNILGSELHPAGGDEYKIRLLEKITNSKGIVSFPVKFQVHIPILKLFKEESIVANQHQRAGQFNDNYYENCTTFRLSHVLPFKSRTVKLIPYVDNLSQCKDNKGCIFLNAYDLALLNNDESYCENVVDEFKTYECYPRFTNFAEQQKDNCYSIIARSKSDINICNKVSEGYQRTSCKELVESELFTSIEYKRYETICNSYFAKDRRFRACENLFEKFEK